MTSHTQMSFQNSIEQQQYLNKKQSCLTNLFCLDRAFENLPQLKINSINLGRGDTLKELSKNMEQNQYIKIFEQEDKEFYYNIQDKHEFYILDKKNNNDISFSDDDEDDDNDYDENDNHQISNQKEDQIQEYIIKLVLTILKGGIETTKEYTCSMYNQELNYQELLKHILIYETQNQIHYLENDSYMILEEHQFKTSLSSLYITKKMKCIEKNHNNNIYYLFSQGILLKQRLSIGKQYNQDTLKLLKYYLCGQKIIADSSQYQRYFCQIIDIIINNNKNNNSNTKYDHKNPMYFLIAYHQNGILKLNPYCCYIYVDSISKIQSYANQNKKYKSLLDLTKIALLSSNMGQSLNQVKSEFTKSQKEFVLNQDNCDVSTLQIPKILFSNFQKLDWTPSNNGNYFGLTQSNTIGEEIIFENWILIYLKQNEKEAYHFDKIVSKFCDALGITLYAPTIITVASNDANQWNSILEKHLDRNNQVDYKFIVSLTQTNQNILDLSESSIHMGDISRNSNVYVSHKDVSIEDQLTQYIVLEKQLIYQNINIDSMNQQTIQNQFLQILPKLQISPWVVDYNILFPDALVIGIDTSKSFFVTNNNQVKEIVSIVASKDNFHTSFYSYSYFKDLTVNQSVESYKDEQLLKVIKKIIKEKLQEQKNLSEIIIYRRCRRFQNTVYQYEINSLNELLSSYFREKNIQLTYVDVCEEKEFKFFSENNNQTPKAGTVMHQKNNNTFYIYTNTTNQDIITTPTKFQILQYRNIQAGDNNSNQQPADVKQLIQFSFNLCFNYFNYQGPIKIPAHLKYAKKLSDFSKKYEVEITGDGEKLKDYLFYL